MSPSQTLPPDLVNLLALHSSFLTALSLHYAHNGTSVPVDVRVLAPSVSQVWRQRAVSLEDIRMLLGVLDACPGGNKNPFYLSDYSGGKICIEIRDEYMVDGKLRNVNEDALQKIFMGSLDHLWTAWSETHVQGVNTRTKLAVRPIAAAKRRGRPRKAIVNVQSSIQPFLDETALPKFLAQLPLAEVSLCSSAAAVAPMREKGRKRLREFKDSVQQGRAVKKANTTITITGKENEPTQATAQIVQPKITEFASVRKSNLLDRILAKQAAAASGPAPLTPAALQRLAALQRSEEVLGVLSLLTASKMPGTRVSFSMAALVQSLQGSIRSPLSKDEVLKCVEVLATEVAPGYLNIVRLGTMSSVVVNQALRPMDVKSRLVALGAA
ncbi:hypothetical protein K505DRAFT_321660 [Melanomma pulvis-pyrius CBS 109.77]|uniref:DNA replication factor Cdt1 C-terminal domain-containing protein n=1 Tax=Melanomma pulvis-pyrius CBS 109.77 TaxID=1314802 RepID=A0A6A6XT67_9PLEO|nr:hypothetical protein K505DRAFT_321660 [Melanomma pulvis-pyrius CBS 109.77]